MNTIQSTFDRLMHYRGLAPGSETERVYTQQIQAAIVQQKAAPSSNAAEKFARQALEKANKWVRLADAQRQVLERAKSRVLRAIVFEAAGRCGDAEFDLEQALGLLGEPNDGDWEMQHLQAAIYWMQGCLINQIEGRAGSGEDQICWQHGIHIIEKLVTHPRADDFRFYSQLAIEMKRFFASFSTEVEAEADAPIEAEPIQPQPTRPIPQILPYPSQAPLQEATLSPNGYFHLDVYPALAAGAFQPIWAQITRPVERVALNNEVESLEIRRRMCRFYSLVPGERLIRLRKSGGERSRQQAYALFYITGDSMNEDGIDPGDYVLVRAQETADPGNIVVLQAQTTEGADTTLTLKYFERRTETEWRFVPHSSNTSHPTFIYHPNTGETAPRIVGIAIGVFKPQGDSNHGQPDL